MALFWISTNGIGNPPYKPAGYRFSEYSWADQALAAARMSAIYDQQPSYFWPLENNPICRVEFSGLRQNLQELWLYSQQPGVVSTDRRMDLLLSKCSVYLPDNRNPEEIVYEVAVWEREATQA